MNTNCSKEVIVPASAAAICISGPQSEAPAQATMETSGGTDASASIDIDIDRRPAQAGRGPARTERSHVHLRSG